MTAPDRYSGIITESDTPLDESASGITTGVSGDPIVDQRGWDASDEPRDDLTTVSPGETVLIRGEEAKVFSLSKRKNFGQTGLYSYFFAADFIGTAATLYVDRDPYLLDICNGPIFPIAPSEVETVD